MTTRFRGEADQAEAPSPRRIGPLVALLPAHNEEECLGGALDSLAAQTHPPERIIVIADNCTDRTPEIALRHGAEV